MIIVLSFNLLPLSKIQYGWCPSYKACSSNINAHLCPLFYDMAYCERNLGAMIWRKSHQFTDASRV